METQDDSVQVTQGTAGSPSQVDQQQNQIVIELYPPPPPFYRAFTSENITKLNKVIDKSGNFVPITKNSKFDDVYLTIPNLNNLDLATNTEDNSSLENIRQELGADAGGVGGVESDGEGEMAIGNGLNGRQTNVCSGDKNYADFTYLFNPKLTDANFLESIFEEVGEKLPGEFKLLVPPPQPESGKYRTFNCLIDINEKLPTLDDLGLEWIKPDAEVDEVKSTTVKNDEMDVSETDKNTLLRTNEADSKDWTLDRAHMLRQLVRSIFLNFCELLTYLSKDPVNHERKIGDLTTLFLNAHHIINECRPYQARASLIQILEKQIEIRQSEIQRVDQLSQEVQDTFIQLASETQEIVDTVIQDTEMDVQAAPTSEVDARYSKQRQMWEMLYNVHNVPNNESIHK